MSRREPTATEQLLRAITRHGWTVQQDGLGFVLTYRGLVQRIPDDVCLSWWWAGFSAADAVRAFQAIHHRRN